MKDGIVTAAEGSITLESAWAFLMAEVAKRQPNPNGEIAIPSGKGTNLWLRVNPIKLPATIAVDLLEAGIRKPITDISVDKESEGSDWKFAHERRTKRRDNWYNGEFSVRGGSADEIGVQMKEEFTLYLKSKGLTAAKFPDYFKGTFVKMVDACEAAGLVPDRADLTKRMNEAAVARLADRGKVAAKLDLKSIQL